MSSPVNFPHGGLLCAIFRLDYFTKSGNLDVASPLQSALTLLPSSYLCLYAGRPVPWGQGRRGLAGVRCPVVYQLWRWFVLKCWVCSFIETFLANVQQKMPYDFSTWDRNCDVEQTVPLQGIVSGTYV